MTLWKITLTSHMGKTDETYVTSENKDDVYTFAESQADSYGCESYSVQYAWLEEQDKDFDISAVTVLN